jgi:hypothetical protein
LLSTLLVLALFAFAAETRESAAAPPQRLEKARPAWKKLLRESLRHPRSLNKLPKIGSYVRQDFVAFRFLSEDRLAIVLDQTWGDPPRPQIDKDLSPKGNTARILHYLEIETTSGRIAADREWIIPPVPKTWYLTAGERFLGVNGDQLTLFDRDWLKVKERSLPGIPETVRLSSGGEVLLLAYGEFPPRSLEVRYADSLELVDTWQEDEWGASYLLADSALVIRPNKDLRDAQEVLVRSFGPSKSSFTLRISEGCEELPVPLSAEFLALSKCRDQVLVFHKSGIVLMKENSEKDESFRPTIHIAQQGRRFAVMIERVHRYYIPFTDSWPEHVWKPERILVFDAQAKRAVLNVTLKSLGPAIAWQLALSPSGSYFAVMPNDFDLHMYRIP